MLPGWCCIANRHIGARERRQLIPHVRFQVPFLGPESQLKSGFACAGLLCIRFCFTHKLELVTSLLCGVCCFLVCLFFFGVLSGFLDERDSA